MIKAKLRSLRDTFWFIPAVYNALAVVTAGATILVDYTVTNRTPVVGAILLPIAMSVELLNTLAAAILTMTTISFSIIMVVLSTYTSQFSPRVLQNFIADRVTQHILGLFTGGVTYSVSALLFMNDAYADTVFFTPAMGVAWALVAIGAFVFLLDHVASWLRVNNLIGIIADETEATIRRVTGQAVERHRGSLALEDLHVFGERTITARAPTTGYVVYVDLDGLFRHTCEQDAVTRMEVRIGEYVIEGAALMDIAARSEAEIDPRRFARHVQLGDEQRNWQDIGFGLRKLVEIAVRATSPGINDPYTATSCIHRLTPLLSRVAHLCLREPAYYDDAGVLRLVVREPGFEDYLFRTFNDIRHYGGDDLAVVLAVLDALAIVAARGPATHHDALWRFGCLTAEGLGTSTLPDTGRSYLEQRVNRLAEATGRKRMTG